VALTVAAAIVRNAAPTPALAAPNEAASPVTDLVRQTAGHGQLIGEISWVPPGAVRLGQAGIAWAEPVHEVLVDGFYIDRHEVSNGSYQAFIDAGGYTVASCWNPVGWAWREERGITRPANWTDARYHGGGIAGNERFPVSGVSWWEADAFCRWAGGRLPTEAEWEKAAKGGCEAHGDPGRCDDADTPSYPWGEDIGGSQANYWESGDPYTDAGTAPVGSHNGSGRTVDSPSPYGLYDVSGNVWEWCSTQYGTYPYDQDDGRESPPAFFNESGRILRGGSWGSHSGNIRCAFRGSAAPDYRLGVVGFRCAWTRPPRASGGADSPAGREDDRTLSVRVDPSPSGGTVRIRCQVPRQGVVAVTVHDASGRLIRRLAHGPRAAGTFSLTWDGRDDSGQPVPSGVFWTRMETAEDRAVERVVLVRQRL